MSQPRIAAIGSVSWDRFLVCDHYPAPGDYTIVRRMLEQPGGTTGNTVTALAQLGLPVTLAGVVGDDEHGRLLRQRLMEAGCDVRYVQIRPDDATDTCTIVVSGDGANADRTIFWEPGARLRHGDRLSIAELFAHDLVIVDLDDARLLRLLVDLPIHVSPRTLILGTMTYLTLLPPADGLELALGYDFLAGNTRELCYLTGQPDLGRAVEHLRDRMGATQLRAAFISRGSEGCVAIDEDQTWCLPTFSIDVVDTTGAGDAFAAGVALGIVERRSLDEIGRIANAMGALATRALGAQSALPSRDELDALLGAGCRGSAG